MNLSIILFNAVIKFFNLLEFLIFVRVFLSWIPFIQDNVLIKLLNNLTEPILYPIRKIIMKSPIGGGGMAIDFSPIIAIIFFYIIEKIIYNILF